MGKKSEGRIYMAVKHYIITSSSYVDGTRIAIDITAIDSINRNEIANSINHIRVKCGQDVSIATHCLSTDSRDWSTVVKIDSFFKNVYLCKDIEEFIAKIRESRILSGLDVAKYILSKIECTHTKLQKLAYLCYADYLCKTREKLFNDTIYAFDYGPVVSSIYDTYKKSNGAKINGTDFELSELNSMSVSNSTATESSAKSKILFSKNGSYKLISIDDTLKKYGSFNANKLVEITHKKDSPWDHIFIPNVSYQCITDSAIFDFHSNENV